MAGDVCTPREKLGRDSEADQLPTRQIESLDQRLGTEHDSPSLSPSPASVTVSAGVVRHGLQLTPHQLGELTRQLGLDVGDRPNYPRYGFDQVQLLVAVKTLRELHVPVDDACHAVRALQDSLASDRGWIVIYPAHEKWVALTAATTDALLSLLSLTVRAVTVDLAALRDRSHTVWLRLAHADG